VKTRVVALALVLAVAGGRVADACWLNQLRQSASALNNVTPTPTPTATPTPTGTPSKKAKKYVNNMSPAALMGAITKSFQQKLEAGKTTEALTFFDKILNKLPKEKQGMIPFLTAMVLRAVKQAAGPAGSAKNRRLTKFTESILDKVDKKTPDLYEKSVQLSNMAVGGSKLRFQKKGEDKDSVKFALNPAVQGISNHVRRTRPTKWHLTSMNPVGDWIAAPFRFSDNNPGFTFYEKKWDPETKTYKSTKIEKQEVDMEKLGKKDFEKLDMKKKTQPTLDKIILDTILDKSSAFFDTTSKQ
jgi:hypothetical protein